MPLTYNISDVEGKLLELFTKKKFQKTDLRKFRLEKVIKRKDDKLYVNGIATITFFNSWID